MSTGRGASDVTEPHQTHEPVAQRVTGAAGSSVTDASSASVTDPIAQDRVIPQATVTRLAAYLRVLGVMSDRGTSIVSSEELAQASGVGSAKLRKDLSFLGPTVSVASGTTSTGSASASSVHSDSIVDTRSFSSESETSARRWSATADSAAAVSRWSDSSTVTQIESEAESGDLVVRSTEELTVACRELNATIGVISTPDEAAQGVCDQFVSAGLRCIMSFSPIALDVPDHVELRRVDLAVEMQVLSFNSARNADQASSAPRVRVAHAASASSVPSTSSPAPVGAGSTRNGSVIAP